MIIDKSSLVQFGDHYCMASSEIGVAHEDRMPTVIRVREPLGNDEAFVALWLTGGSATIYRQLNGNTILRLLRG